MPRSLSTLDKLSQLIAWPRIVPCSNRFYPASKGEPAWPPSSEATPERTAFVCFRRALITHGLDRTLFETNTAELKAKSITIKTVTLVHTTIIASASETNGDGR
jgi:IS5 family transposase